MFSKRDLALLRSKNISFETVTKQLNRFENGFPFIKLEKAATINNGIMQIGKPEKQRFIDLHEKNFNLKIAKFVPASGAASRMFKSLYEFKELYGGNNKGYANFMKSSGLNTVLELIMKIEKFAFYKDLKEVLKKDGKNISKMIVCMDYAGIIDAILNKEGLNYGHLPKGLIKFHNYEESYRTALEEHLVEGALYCKDKTNTVNLHFTISIEHKSLFLQKLDTVKKQYEADYNVNFQIKYSVQKPSTDTIAVDTYNFPYRDNNDNLLFRPGGHGALIENLKEIEYDIIFIKNIDNVVVDPLKAETVKYKKIISGVLLHYQQKIFRYLQLLQNKPNKETINKLLIFLEKELCILPGNRNADISYIKEKLNRPIRVCGMVKNKGEPGGGPFWCYNQDGTISLQIVESSQIDNNNNLQLEILKNATHFNPVDIVCSLNTYKGNKFELSDYVDDSTGFISTKSYNGDKIKAQELPGLWNGAMSDWNTIFVEVPIITFNPVKTISDLLRKEHQSTLKNKI